ncbi:MAG: tRNA-dihydrouridine synthase family protein [Bacteroidaceae bacterium]|nr:tRNA-dihydrouridine synthase family protein [Bacteroidaceae bacterium]
MKIGKLDLGERPVFLAPMEDVTDIGFRLLCRRMGAAMVYSEFVAADALVRMVNKSLKKLEVCDEERPVAIQIYGKEPEPMAEAARIVVEQAHPDVLDLNFGCPVKKIAGKGAGAGMLQNPPKLLAITRAVVDAVGAEVPVTVKTRLGWDHEHKIIVELAEQLQDCGISALTIHGRTRSQMYTDQADWTLIGEVKRNPRMTIPIIGNGDITSAEKAVEAFERYGVDAIMVGRATFGRPWIFKEITEALHPIPSSFSPSGSAPLSPSSSSVPGGLPAGSSSLDWKLDILKEQTLTSIARLGELSGIRHVRRHLAASPLFKGIPDFRQTRIKMLQADTQKELFEVIEYTRGLLHQLLFFTFLFFSFHSFAQSTPWRIEAESPESRVLWRNDTLDITAPKGLSLWWRKPLTAPCTISYRACVVMEGGPCDRLSDLNCFWMASLPSANEGKEQSPFPGGGAFVEYYRLQCYYLGYGGNHNTTTRFRRYDGDTLAVTDPSHRPPILKQYTDSAHLLKPNHWYSIRIHVTADGRTRYFIDDELLVDYQDPSPLLHGHFAFRTTWSHTRLTAVRIEESTQPK